MNLRGIFKIFAAGGAVLFAAAPANAQVIEQINIQGLYHLSKSQALKAAGLKRGQDVSSRELDAALKRLYAFGYFEDISLHLDGGRLQISVKEKPFAAKITIKGAPSNDKRTLEGVVAIRKGQTADDARVQKSIEKIIEFYEGKGYYDTTVRTELKPLKTDGSVAANELIFHVNRGEQIVIKKVNLIGAKKLKYSKLSKGLANKEREAMGWMWGFDDGKLRAKELENDPERIRQTYLNRGYLDATVSAPALLADFKSHSAQLNYYIYEGERYKVDEVEIISPNEEIKINRSALELEKGKWFNVEKMRKDMDELARAYADEGYALAQVLPDVQKTDGNKAKIVYTIEPGEIYHIGRVIIDGNSKSTDKIIRRELYLAEGMKFSRTDLVDSIIALRKTGYFGDVKITPVPSFLPGELDLHVEVAEKRTGSVIGGVGYSTTDGVLLNASVSDKNVLGTGLSGTVGIEKSKKDLTGRIGLSNPRIFDSRYQLGGSLYSYSHDWNNYEELNRGVEINLGREFGRRVSAGINYNLEQSDLRKATTKMVLSGEKLGRRIRSAATPYILYDSTDDYLLPRNGIFARASYTYAGLGGDVDYKKISADFKYYKGFLDEFDTDLIFRLRANVSKLFNYEQTPLNNRLYLGGSQSLRGFEPDSLSPKANAYYLTGLGVAGKELPGIEKITREEYEAFLKLHANDTPLEQLLMRAERYEYDLGGALRLNATAELSFPISEKLNLRGAVFYDYGMIGVKKFSEIKRSSAGLSLDWITPMGTLNFVFAKPLDAKDGDKTNRFEFNIGGHF